MKQRVSIARAFAYNPDFIMMDEPFSALDFFTREHIEYNPAMFINDDWLWLFFLNFMNRVIRFQSIKGRKVYGVMDLI